METRSTRPLWRCPQCRRKFANRNQSHFCGRYTLSRHFEGKTAEAKHLFEELVRLIKTCGRVTILPEKTRIAFATRMSFAAVSIQKSSLSGHLVLAERHDSPVFRKIQTISPRNHVHCFKIARMEDFTHEFLAFLPLSYAVGQQKHLL